MNFGTWKSCGLVSRWTAKSEKKPYGTRPSRADCFLSWSIFILCRKIFLLVEQARQILHVFIDGGSQRHFRRFRCRFSSVADWLLSMMTPSAVNFFVMSLLRLMDHLTVHNIQKKTLLIFTAHPRSSSMETQNSSDVGGRPGENCAPITLYFFLKKRKFVKCDSSPSAWPSLVNLHRWLLRWWRLLHLKRFHEICSAAADELFRSNQEIRGKTSGKTGELNPIACFSPLKNYLRATACPHPLLL